MRAIVIREPGGPDVLELRDVPTPTPQRGEARVRVRATAVNRADLIQRMGAYPAPPDSPRDIPGLEHAEFLRYGQIHRNTYINAPRLLAPDLSLRTAPQVFVAGQLSGVEGYVECIATGLLAGWALAARAGGETYSPPPRSTALGSLVHYVTHADSGSYQPANISFDLLPPPDNLPRAMMRDRSKRRACQCQQALADLAQWREHCAITGLVSAG